MAEEVRKREDAEIIFRICVASPSTMAGAELDAEEMEDVVTQVNAALDEETDDEGKALERDARVEAICASLLNLTEAISKAKKAKTKQLSLEAVAQAVWLVVTGKEFEENHPPAAVVYCDPNEGTPACTVRIVAYADVESFDEVVAAMREAGYRHGTDRAKYH